MILLVFVAQRLVVSDQTSTPAPTFNQFLQDIDDGQVKQATIKVQNNEVDVVLDNGRRFTTGYPEEYADTLTEDLRRADVPFEVKGIPGSPWCPIPTSISPSLIWKLGLPTAGMVQAERPMPMERQLSMAFCAAVMTSSRLATIPAWTSSSRLASLPM